MKKYSRQRAAVLKALSADKSHPTANKVYDNVRKELPNISLGTVYRNLSDLCDSGEAIRISVGDGFEHFDADVSPHIHLHCRVCGETADLYSDTAFAENAARDIGFEPEGCTVVINGVCKNCLKRQ